MSKNTQRQHYLHQLTTGVQKREVNGKRRRTFSSPRKRNTS
jgi:hypothetical protein